MTEREPSHPDGIGEAKRDRFLITSAVAQLREDSRAYNAAVGSFNTHLERHRDRRELADIPFREPVSAHDAFEGALSAERSDVERLLESLVGQTHLDSQVRRHPDVHPIHREAVTYLRITRAEVVSTLETLLLHLDRQEGS